MARLTVEDCLAQESNRFALVVLAAGRAKQLALGAPARVVSHNRSAVVALREITAGRVRFNENVHEVVAAFIAEKKAHTNDGYSRGDSRKHRTRTEKPS